MTRLWSSAGTRSWRTPIPSGISGDFALGPGPVRVAELVGSLHGEKHLLIGNNDDAATIAASGWASVGHYAELTVDGRPLVLCHYAFRTWNDMGRGALNLHGHSHGKLTPIPKQYDVGVDAQDFRPVTLPQILVSRRRGARSGGRSGLKSVTLKSEA